MTSGLKTPWTQYRPASADRPLPCSTCLSAQYTYLTFISLLSYERLFKCHLKCVSDTFIYTHAPKRTPICNPRRCLIRQGFILFLKKPSSPLPRHPIHLRKLEKRQRSQPAQRLLRDCSKGKINCFQNKISRKEWLGTRLWSDSDAQWRTLERTHHTIFLLKIPFFLEYSNPSFCQLGLFLLFFPLNHTISSTAHFYRGVSFYHQWTS